MCTAEFVRLAAQGSSGFCCKRSRSILNATGLAFMMCVCHYFACKQVMLASCKMRVYKRGRRERVSHTVCCLSSRCCRRGSAPMVSDDCCMPQYQLLAWHPAWCSPMLTCHEMLTVLRTCCCCVHERCCGNRLHARTPSRAMHMCVHVCTMAPACMPCPCRWRRCWFCWLHN